MEKITIVGCGWLGLPSGRRLTDLGYTVKGTTRDPERLKRIAEAGIIPVQADFGGDIPEEQIIHLSNSDLAIIAVPWSRRLRDEENTEVYRSIADTLAFEGIERAILISSTSVYPADLAVCLESDADPDHALLQAEQYIQERIASTCVIRFSGLIGPGRHPARFLAGKKGVPAPNAPVNLIHLDDCCGIIELMIEKRLEGVFNACAPSHPTRKEFYEIACSHLGIAPPEFDEADLSSGREISIVKLLEETGYEFVHSDLFEALDHCL